MRLVYEFGLMYFLMKIIEMYINTIVIDLKMEKSFIYIIIEMYCSCFSFLLSQFSQFSLRKNLCMGYVCFSFITDFQCAFITFATANTNDAYSFI